MINVRATLAAARAAIVEARELASFLIRRADDRWVLHREHRWVDDSTLADRNVHEVCGDCGARRTVAR